MNLLIKNNLSVLYLKAKLRKLFFSALVLDTSASSNSMKRLVVSKVFFSSLKYHNYKKHFLMLPSQIYNVYIHIVKRVCACFNDAAVPFKLSMHFTFFSKTAEFIYETI